MSCLKEQSHRNQLESGCESSAVCPESYSSRHTRAWDPIIHASHPGEPSDFIGPGVIPHLVGGGDEGCPGQSRKAPCGRVVEPQCTNYRFDCPLPLHHDPEASLPQRELPPHPEYHVLGAESNPYHFPSPMPSLAYSSHPSSWATEGMAGEIYDAMANICPESMNYQGCELFPKQDTMAELIPQNQMDISQSANGPLTVFLQPLQLGDNNTVLCTMKGGGHMVLVNHCSPGEIIHSLPTAPGHQASRGPPEPCLFLGKKEGVLVRSSQIGAPPSSQPYLGLPPPQSTHTLLGPSQIGSGYTYSNIPGPYFPQYQQAPCPLYPISGGWVPDSQPQAPGSGGAASQLDLKSKKPCHCTKSQCLKLYCDCFANGDFCNNCNCVNCFNNSEHELERYAAVKICLERNPVAFQPKIGNGKSGEVKGRHNKGCNCKRSGCLKNYCECYEAKIMCSTTCRCVDCKNYEGSPERRVMLCDSPDTTFYRRVKCQKNRCPLSGITLNVVEATCGCLLAEAEKAEKEEYTLSQAEKMILEEFGQCLTQIVHSIFKSTGLQEGAE